ncbi:MAG TPA: hypothetical protein VI504_09500 [Candidatus Eisenbacteria bacterium]|jgi:hypothetical protein
MRIVPPRFVLLGRLALAALLGYFPLAALLGLVTLARAADDDPRRRAPTGWDVRLSPPGEPGEPFELSGRVLEAGGRPLAGARLFAYHADARGEYGVHYPRLAATLLSGPHGEYRLRTVFPGGYGGYPAHVHFELKRQTVEFSFVNVFPTGARLAATPFTVASRGRDGVWRARWDVWSGRSPQMQGGGGGMLHARARATRDLGAGAESAWEVPWRPGARPDSLRGARADSARKR